MTRIDKYWKRAAAGLLTAKPLQDALAQVGRLTSYHYTAASWAVLEAAAADARALLEGSFSQQQLDELHIAVTKEEE